MWSVRNVVVNPARWGGALYVCRMNLPCTISSHFFSSLERKFFSKSMQKYLAVINCDLWKGWVNIGTSWIPEAAINYLYSGGDLSKFPRWWWNPMLLLNGLFCLNVEQLVSVTYLLLWCNCGSVSLMTESNAHHVTTSFELSFYWASEASFMNKPFNQKFHLHLFFYLT